MKITSIKDTGSFNQVQNNPKKNYSLAYNNDKQLLYKLKSNNTLSVIFDEIFHNSYSNRQFRIDESGTLVTIQSRQRDVVVVSGIEDDQPLIISKIKGVPGDIIIDFKYLDESKVVCLTKNGFLSCYDISKPEA